MNTMLKENKGSSTLLLAVVITFSLFILCGMISVISKTSSKSTLHHKTTTRAMEIADIGIYQMLSDIHQYNITSFDLDNQRYDLINNQKVTEITRSYYVPKHNSSETEQVIATLTIVPDIHDVDGDGNDCSGTGKWEAETDIEDNPIYQIDSVATLTNSLGHAIGRKHVTAMISIINLSKFLVFNPSEDPANRSGWWAEENRFDGYVHINTDLRMRGDIFVNAYYHPYRQGIYKMTDPGYITGDPLFKKNPCYSPEYSVVVAGKIKKMDYHDAGSVVCRTQGDTEIGDPSTLSYNPYNNDTLQNYLYAVGGYMSQLVLDNTEHGQWSHVCGGKTPGEVEENNTYFSTVPTDTNPRGTWFDGSHGGFVIDVEPIDFNFLSNFAHVFIDINDITHCKAMGTIYDGSNLFIDIHYPNHNTNVVDIDLGALGTGSTKDVCRGSSNYTNALQDIYGLVIFVTGPIAVHGKLAVDTTGIANQNKRITIISTKTVDILGDILYSGDPYMQILDNFTSFQITNNDSQISSMWYKDPTTNVTIVPGQTGPVATTGALYFNDHDGQSAKTCVSASGNPSANNQLILHRKLPVVAPLNGIDHNKLYVNVKRDAGWTVDPEITLAISDTTNNYNTIVSTGPLTLNTTAWKRIVLTEITQAQAEELKPGGNYVVSLKVENIDHGGNRNLYINELCFAFGKPFPFEFDFSNYNAPNSTNNPNNPTNDAIALISNENVYFNSWYLHERGSVLGDPLGDAHDGSNPDHPINDQNHYHQYHGPLYPPRPDSIKYFAVNGDYTEPFYWEDCAGTGHCPNDDGDTGWHGKGTANYPTYYYAVKLDYFLYINTPGAVPGYRRYNTGNHSTSEVREGQINYRLRYGTTINRGTGYGTAFDSYHFYDKALQYNISRIIPAGTAIHTWQEK